jgi:hypothetical protein
MRSNIPGKKISCQPKNSARNFNHSENPPWHLAEGRASGPEEMAAMPQSNRGAVVDRPGKWALQGVERRASPWQERGTATVQPGCSG